MSSVRTIVVTVPGMISDSDLEPLRALGDVVYHEVDHVSQNELAHLCAGFDYLMLNYDVVKQLDEQFYDNESVLKLSGISTDITGMDWASPHAAAAKGLLVMNVPHYSTESVAESILSEVLLHARQRHLAYVDERLGRTVEARQGLNLRGRVGGVIGLGDIGSRVAELLGAVGMEVLAWSKTPRKDSRLVDLPALFDRSAVICLTMKTVTDGPDTNVGIVDEALLSRCKGTIIVNLANWQLVDEAAMARALADGRVLAYSVERSDRILATPLGAVEAVHLPPSNAWSSEESLATLREVWVSNVVSAIGGFPSNVLGA